MKETKNAQLFTLKYTQKVQIYTEKKMYSITRYVIALFPNMK